MFDEDLRQLIARDVARAGLAHARREREKWTHVLAQPLSAVERRAAEEIICYAERDACRYEQRLKEIG